MADLHWPGDRRRRFLALGVLKTARWFVRQPLSRQIRFLGWAEKAAGLFRPTAVEPLRDLKETIRDDERGRTAVRRLISEARDTQIISILQGVLRHHLPSAGETAGAAVGQPQSGLRVALLGEHYEFTFLREAYQEQGAFILAPETDRLPDGLDSVEIALLGEQAMEWAKSALRRRIAVSVHPAGASANKINELIQLARSLQASFRVFHADLYYPPLRRLFALLASGEIGELAMVRIRAILGGTGGIPALDPPFGEDPLRHPAFNHAPLLARLGGPIERLAAYLQPMDRIKGGQGLVDCRYAAPGRYGLLECVYAPAMHLPSLHYPHDLEVEVTGTDGFIVVRRGMAERTQAAPLSVRIGRTAYTIGVESGLDADWAAVYRVAVSEMSDMIRGAARPAIDDTSLLSALRLQEAIPQAARAEATIGLP